LQTRLEAFSVEQFLANRAQVWRTGHRFGERLTDFSLQIQHNDLANFVKAQKVGKIDEQFFCQTLCTGIFSLGKQS